MRLLISAFLLLYAHFAIAQEASIQGYVRSDGEPIQFAVVSIQHSGAGAVTDAEGFFRVNGLHPGNYELQVALIGFETVTLSLQIREKDQIFSVGINLVEAAVFLDEVVVSGTLKEVSRLASPVPVEVYKASFFKMNPTPSLFESLQNVNGVRPQLNCNVCNTGDIQINGLPGPYTMVLIDGMPIVSGLSTVYGLTGIPQSLIERIEVVKGPASTLYGSEAVGGLINVITKNPENASRVGVDVFGTSWGEVNTDVGIRFNPGKQASSLLGVNYFNYANPIDNNGDNFTDVALQERVSVFNKWRFNTPGNKLFTLAGRYVYENRWGGEMQWTPEFTGTDSVYGETIQTNRWEILSAYELPFADNLLLQVSANGHRQRSAYGTMRYDGDQYIGFGQLTWHTQLWRKHDLLVGLTARYTYYDDNTTATAVNDSAQPVNDPAITWLPGFFLQDEIYLNNQNKLLLGVRYDWNSIHGSILSPRLNYKWNSANKRSTLRFTAGNGFRVANIFTEDHAALNGARELVILEDLAPEKSWNVNLNYVQSFLTANRTYLNLDVTLFYTYFTNQIIPDYETDPNKIIYANLNGFSVSRGISLNTRITFPVGLSINAGFTAMDVFFEENGIRQQPLFTERFNAVYTISYPFSRIGLTVDLTGNLFGPMRLPLLSVTDPRPGMSHWWGNQNIQLTKVFAHGFTLYGGIKNVLNYMPPANSIARAHDPFDKKVQFDANGNVLATAENPYALTFDPTYVFAPNQGIRFFIGVRYTLN